MPHSPGRSAWRVSTERGGRGCQSAPPGGSVDAFLLMERGAVSRVGRMAARDGASRLAAAALVATSCLWSAAATAFLSPPPREPGATAALASVPSAGRHDGGGLRLRVAAAVSQRKRPVRQALFGDAVELPLFTPRGSLRTAQEHASTSRWEPPLCGARSQLQIELVRSPAGVPGLSPAVVGTLFTVELMANAASGERPAERSSDETAVIIYMGPARSRRRDCTDAGQPRLLRSDGFPHEALARNYGLSLPAGRRGGRHA